VDYNYDGSVAQKLVYTYDAQGRSTGYEEYTGALAAPRRHVYVADDQGRRVEYRIVQPDGAAGEKYLYKYDAKGNLSEEALHEHKGALISRNTFAYDGEGRQVSQTRYNSDGSVSSTSSTSYDAHGRPVERVRHEGDILTYRVRYTYDAKGRVVAQETVGSVVEADVSPSEAHAPGRVVYVYKGKEWPHAALVYAPDGSLRERVEIEYDSRGNWTRKTRLTQPGAASQSRRVEYRAITYFKGE
jgi:YD repeat-containing protein